MKRPSSSPSECPVCGEDVPRGAAACPHCGADERSGWNEDDAAYDGLDLPEEEEEWDSGNFHQREFGTGFKPHGMSWWWWLVALAILAAFVLRRVF